MATRMDVKPRVEMPVGSAVDTAGFPVYWSALFAGALTGVVVSLLLGLLAVALGAYQPTAGGRLGPEDFGYGDFAAAVGGSFFAFVAAGWVATRIAGYRQPEPAALHGALAWLVAVPMMLLFIAFGAGSLFGAWYTGLAGTPVWVTRSVAASAEMAQEAAGGALTALLIGLVGAVLGGWLGSGEPMRVQLTDYRRRGRKSAA